MRYFMIAIGLTLSACGTGSSGGGAGSAYTPIACGAGGACPQGMACVNSLCATRYGDAVQDAGARADTGGGSSGSGGAVDAGRSSSGGSDSGGGVDAGGSSSGGAVDAGGSGSGGGVDAGRSSSGGKVDAGGSSSGGSGSSSGGGSGCSGVAGSCYESMVIYDGTKAAPTVCTGTGPGADIDFVAVWHDNKIVAVGRKGTANYSAGSGAGCGDNVHNTAADVGAVAGGFGDICRKGNKPLDIKDCSQSDLAGGYLSLGGGSVELEFAACELQGGTDGSYESCSGKGAAIGVRPGDEIDVYEVGQQYKKDYGFACKCADEGFEVDLRPKVGIDTGSITLGAASGTKTFTVPK